MRIDLLHAHGSPTDYLYVHSGCRCTVCRAARSESGRRDRAAHPDRDRLWREANPEYAHHYYEAHREKQAEWARLYRVAHFAERAAEGRNRYARKMAAPGTHTASDVQAQYERQRGKCFWGRRVNPECTVGLKSGYHVDHVTPLVKQGSNGRENLVLACAKCNLRKNAKHPMDWAGVLL